MPYANDGSITYENVIIRYNSDLVNNLGNLVKRTVDMTQKYFEGEILAPSKRAALDDELISVCINSYSKSIELMNSYHIADAADSIFTMLRRANKYIDETTPWVLAKDENNRERLATVLYNLLEVIRWGAVLLTPFIPESAEKIFDILNTDKRTLDTIGNQEKFSGIEVGGKVGKSTVLFARIDEKKMLAEIEAERLAQAEQTGTETVEKPVGVAQIGIEDFMNVELRTALVEECERIPKAKKLLKLTVNLGYEKRTVVSGIAKFYTPEQLIGKKLIIVANLKPVTLCSIESNGMILACGEEQVRVVFLSDDTPLGERVR